jgi:uncharacterized phage-associated protein
MARGNPLVRLKGRNMNNITQIADYFVARSITVNNPINVCQLQNLVGLSNIFSYMRFGKPLFSEQVKVNEQGLRIHSLQQTFKKFGLNAIEDIPEPSQYNKETSYILLKTWEQFGKYQNWFLLDIINNITTDSSILDIEHAASILKTTNY